MNGISFSFMCPDVLGSIGSGLGDLLGGGTSRRRLGRDEDLLGEELVDRGDYLGDDGDLVVHFAEALKRSVEGLAKTSRERREIVHESL